MSSPSALINENQICSLGQARVGFLYDYLLGYLLSELTASLEINLPLVRVDGPRHNSCLCHRWLTSSLDLDLVDAETGINVFQVQK